MHTTCALSNWVLTFEAPMFSVIVRHGTKRSNSTALIALGMNKCGIFKELISQL